MVDMIGDMMKRNVDMAAGLSGALLESLEHVGRLNMHLAQRQIERFGQMSDLSRLKTGEMPMSLFPDEIMHYPQAMYEIIAHTQTRVAQILGENFREATREAQQGLRQGLSGMPGAMAGAMASAATGAAAPRGQRAAEPKEQQRGR